MNTYVFESWPTTYWKVRYKVENMTHVQDINVQGLQQRKWKYFQSIVKLSCENEVINVIQFSLFTPDSVAILLKQIISSQFSSTPDARLFAICNMNTVT